jgi:hypothetical protein
MRALEAVVCNRSDFRVCKRDDADEEGEDDVCDSDSSDSSLQISR